MLNSGACLQPSNCELNHCRLHPRSTNCSSYHKFECPWKCLFVPNIFEAYPSDLTIFVWQFPCCLEQTEYKTFFGWSTSPWLKFPVINPLSHYCVLVPIFCRLLKLLVIRRIRSLNWASGFRLLSSMLLSNKVVVLKGHHFLMFSFANHASYKNGNNSTITFLQVVKVFIFSACHIRVLVIANCFRWQKCVNIFRNNCFFFYSSCNIDQLCIILNACKRQQSSASNSQ